jgi:hypothetical protein
MAQTPIANKYHEGQMQRTLKRELKVPEIVEEERVANSLREKTESLRCWRG